MNKEQIQAELRLFKAYTDSKGKYLGSISETALEKGIVIAETVPAEILNEAIEMYGIKDELIPLLKY